MKNSIYAFAATLAIAILSMTGSAMAQGNGSQTFKNDVNNWWAWNACCEEIIQLSGTIHATVKLTDNGDGTMTWSINQNWSGGKGTGLSTGNSYNFAENVKASETVTTATFVPFSYDVTVYTRYTGKGKNGKDCSGRVKITYRVSVDEFWNVTVEVYEISFDCANGAQIL